MARDYTKYSVKNIGENLNKRQLVFEIVKDYVNKNKPSFEELIKIFPDEIQGSKGVIKKESEVKDAKRYNMREPLAIKNGALVVVSNQWGNNITDFIKCATDNNYNIEVVSQSDNKEEPKTAENDGPNFDSNFPNSFMKQIFDNRKDEEFLALIDDFLERKLSVGHKYYGAAKLFESISNRYYENENDEFVDCYGYDNEDYDSAYKIVEDEWELKEILNETHLIDKVLELEELEVTDITSIDFKLYYSGYFKFVVECLAYCEDAELLAEFLFAQSLGNSMKIDEVGFNYGEDWLIEFIDILLEYYYGIDVNDYQNDYISDGSFFGVSGESGMDYIQIAQEIIDSVI